MVTFKVKILYLLSKVSLWKNRVVLLLWPNLLSVIRNQIVFEADLPAVNQLMLFNGSGNLIINGNCSFGYKLGGRHRGGSVEIQCRTKESKISIGKNVATNNNVFICSSNYIEIGDNSLIGQNIMITGFEAHGTSPFKRTECGEIGTVTGVFPANVIIGGMPAKILKNIDVNE